MKAQTLLIGALLVVLLAITGMPQPAAAQDTTTYDGPNGTFTVVTDGPDISISFLPKHPPITCSDIKIIQIGRLLNGDGDHVRPGTEGANLEHMDDDMLEDGSWVDHLYCESDPYTNGYDNPQDGNDDTLSQKGHAGADGVQAATFWDSPHVPGTAEDTRTVEFEVCAVCSDPYSVLACFKWEYTNDGTNESSTPTTGGEEYESPSTSFNNAVSRFRARHTNEDGDAYCPELAAAREKVPPPTNQPKAKGVGCGMYMSAAPIFRTGPFPTTVVFTIDSILCDLVPNEKCYGFSFPETIVEIEPSGSIEVIVDTLPETGFVFTSIDWTGLTIPPIELGPVTVTINGISSTGGILFTSWDPFVQDPGSDPFSIHNGTETLLWSTNIGEIQGLTYFYGIYNHETGELSSQCFSHLTCSPLCSCPFQCDYDENGFIDALDLNAMIDVLFFGVPDLQDPNCPASRSDFDNSGHPDALDLNDLIDYLFFSGPGPVQPCSSE